MGKNVTTEQNLVKLLNLRPIAYYLFYGLLMDSTTGGILLSQLMYWFANTSLDTIRKTNEQLMAETGLTPREFRSAKIRLKALPFITIQRSGMPAKTQYQIDWDSFTKYGLKKAKEFEASSCAFDTTSRADSTRQPYTTYKLNKTIKQTTLSAVVNTTSDLERNNKKSTVKKHPRWKKLAEQLHNAITKVHRVDYSKQLPFWANSFRLLHTQDKVTVPRIREVLNWYCQQLPKKDPFLPIAHSGHTFRSKFIRIEQSKERQQQVTNAYLLLPKTIRGVHRKRAEQLRQKLGDSQYDVEQTQLAQLLQVVDEWEKDLGEIADAHADRKNVRYRAEMKKMGQATTIVGNSLENLRAILNPGGSRLVDVFGEWFVNEITSWDHWGGSLRLFFPMHKHFKRFIEYCCRTQGRPLSVEEKDLMYAETKS